MMLDNIRLMIKDNVGKRKLFKYKGVRNQVEEFYGKIVEVYFMVFIIEIECEKSVVKSFSYSDVLTNNLVIK